MENIQFQCLWLCQQLNDEISNYFLIAATHVAGSSSCFHSFSPFFLHILRQDIHHDWQRQFHSELGHRALRHFLALQANQWTQGEDGDALLGPSVRGGNLWKRRGAERLAVGGVNGERTGRPIPGNPPERGSHLRHSGMTHSTSSLFCSLILSLSLQIIQYKAVSVSIGFCVWSASSSLRCLTLSCECMNVFLSPATLPSSYLPPKSLLYIFFKAIWSIDGFFLTFVLTRLSAFISIYCISRVLVPILAAQPSITGGWWKTGGLEGLTAVAVRCCFVGSVRTLTSKDQDFFWQPTLRCLLLVVYLLSSHLLLYFFCISSLSHPCWNQCPSLLLHHYLT